MRIPAQLAINVRCFFILSLILLALASSVPAQQTTPTAPSSAPSLSAQNIAIAKAPVAIATPAPQAVPSGSVQSAALVVPVPAHSDGIKLGQRLFDETRDGSDKDPFSWSVHIYKTRHLLEIYYKNQLFRTFHAVFGRNPQTGGKQWEGDSRTPEGAYLIVAKHPSARFDWFLRINYPNATDQERFQTLKIDHTVGARAHLGGEIGIHGTDSPILNIGNVNWTLGCISVDNADVDEMARLLPIGTLVVISP